MFFIVGGTHANIIHVLSVSHDPKTCSLVLPFESSCSPSSVEIQKPSPLYSKLAMTNSPSIADLGPIAKKGEGETSLWFGALGAGRSPFQSPCTLPRFDSPYSRLSVNRQEVSGKRFFRRFYTQRVYGRKLIIPTYQQQLQLHTAHLLHIPV